MFPSFLDFVLTSASYYDCCTGVSTTISANIYRNSKWNICIHGTGYYPELTGFKAKFFSITIGAVSQCAINISSDFFRRHSISLYFLFIWIMLNTASSRYESLYILSIIISIHLVEYLVGSGSEVLSWYFYALYPSGVVIALIV